MANAILSPTTTEKQAMPVHFYSDGIIMVESQTSPDLLYRVAFDVELGHYTCGCPDFYHRSRVCKHIRRVEAVMEVADSIVRSYSEQAAQAPQHTDAGTSGQVPPGPLSNGCPRCTRRLSPLDSSLTVLTAKGETEEIHPNCLESSDEILEYRSHSYKLRCRLSEAA